MCSWDGDGNAKATGRKEKYVCDRGKREIAARGIWINVMGGC